MRIIRTRWPLITTDKFSWSCADIAEIAMPIGVAYSALMYCGSVSTIRFI